jgi:hypothetical protein
MSLDQAVLEALIRTPINQPPSAAPTEMPPTIVVFECDCTILCQRLASAAALSGSTTYRRILARTNGFNSGAANR